MHKIKEMGLWREELSSQHTKIHTKRRWLFSEKLNVFGCVGVSLCVNTFLALFSYRAFFAFGPQHSTSSNGLAAAHFYQL